MSPPHYPTEYTQGFVEFFYRRFKVNESVLIPRFETECLVREAIKIGKNTPFDTLIDVGTGSGILPISIARELEIRQVYALDLSPDALKVAKENAQMNKVEIQFLQSDLLSIFLEQYFSLGKNILLVTNLPYIKQNDWENMSLDTRYEPKMALFGGEKTGFELYERLFSQIPSFLEKYTPEKLLIIAEIGEDQEVIASELLEKTGWNFSFFPDQFGVRRFIRIDI